MFTVTFSFIKMVCVWFLYTFVSIKFIQFLETFYISREIENKIEEKDMKNVIDWFVGFYHFGKKNIFSVL